jgi:excisionase family DNA binding protein
MTNDTATPAPLADVLTPGEAAALLRLPEPSVRSLLRSGALRGARLGKLWRIRRSDIDAMFAVERRAPPAPDAQVPTDDRSADIVAPSVVLSAPRSGRPGRKRKVRRAPAGRTEV